MKLLITLITFATLQISFAGTPIAVPAPTPFTDSTAAESFAETIFHSGGLAVGAYPSVMLGTLPANSKAKDRFGGGIFALYPVAQYAWVGLRLDWISGALYAPSATLGARYTLEKLPLKPTFFTTGGLVYTISGAGVDTKTVGAIAGLGVIGNLKTSKDGNKTLDIFIEGEKWTNLPGEILHFGIAGGIKF